MDRSNGRFAGHYEDWQQKRINKIVQICGEEYFRGKTVLELACGYGDIGKYFREKLGAIVTFTDGRAEHIPFIQENNPGAEVIQLDQETKWNLGRKFDIVIHFGVMYHLDNWQQDLSRALEHTKDVLFLESEIADSFDPRSEFKFIDMNGYDQALNPGLIATRPSAKHVQSEIIFNGATFTRYDDQDLNSSFHSYSWIEEGYADKLGDNYSRADGVGKRRFWIIYK